MPFDGCFASDPYGGPDIRRGARDGTELPVVPEYKTNLIGRYRLEVGSLAAFAQAALVYQSDSRSTLVPFDEGILARTAPTALRIFP